MTDVLAGVEAPEPAARPGEPLVEVRDLVKHFPLTSGLILQRKVGAVRAVDGISFDVMRGETLGLVGESGCGKSTTARLLLRLLDPTSGSVKIDGREIATIGGGELKAMRREMQMIFQDPYSSLNPRKTVGSIISEPFVIHGLETGEGRRKQVVRDLMDIVGLNPEHYNRYPHEFSGGQRQRIGVARAMALKPKLIVADEPVSALDVSIQAQILNLLQELQREFGLTLIFIAHDLSVVRHMCDRVAVMYLGKIVELADSDALYAHPRMPYTGALMSAVPVPDPAPGGGQDAPGAHGRRALADQPAAGLPLPHALLEGAGALQPRGPAARAQGRAATSPPVTSRSPTRRSPSACRPPAPSSGRERGAAPQRAARAGGAGRAGPRGRRARAARLGADGARGRGRRRGRAGRDRQVAGVSRRPQRRAAAGARIGRQPGRRGGARGGVRRAGGAGRRRLRARGDRLRDRRRAAGRPSRAAANGGRRGPAALRGRLGRGRDAALRVPGRATGAGRRWARGSSPGSPPRGPDASAALSRARRRRPGGPGARPSARRRRPSRPSPPPAARGSAGSASRAPPGAARRVRRAARAARCLVTAWREIGSVAGESRGRQRRLAGERAHDDAAGRIGERGEDRAEVLGLRPAARPGSGRAQGATPAPGRPAAGPRRRRARAPSPAARSRPRACRRRVLERHSTSESSSVVPPAEAQPRADLDVLDDAVADLAALPPARGPARPARAPAPPRRRATRQARPRR